ncbi:hypothetical protein Rsub_08530 [Raphidocelis subcapitata]|uniref:Fungal lipase-type domain-containing protein n=1 Tax=Raphidocelis subcapitata TaxID=307507 RepID=A0A2V0P7K8_9CHLO|nr:hypothetical protein Rsub_08530 [Raphidocelis subcapitata]|eukprot:GBF95549.1 hypothetical protein Rsub_08530 [Raphidocelis subcapitata]
MAAPGPFATAGAQPALAALLGGSGTGAAGAAAGPADAATAALAAELCADLYPKNVSPNGRPCRPLEYQRGFARRWCSGRGALGAAFVDSLRLHAAVVTFPDGAVMVVFRGTDGQLQRWLNRWVLMATVKLPAADGGGGAAAARVHAAWWASLQQVLPRLRAHIDAALAAAAAPHRLGRKAAAASGRGGCPKAAAAAAAAAPAPAPPGGAPRARPPPRLYFAGHSLGGAFAQLCAAQLWRDYPVAGVFAFGAPRVGCADWARLYGSVLGARTRAFANEGDGVPLQPPSIPVVAPYCPLARACIVRVDSGDCGGGGGGGAGGLSSWGSVGSLLTSWGSIAGASELPSERPSDGGASDGGASACAPDSGAAEGGAKPRAGRARRRSAHNEHAYVDAVSAWLAAQAAA